MERNTQRLTAGIILLILIIIGAFFAWKRISATAGPGLAAIEGTTTLDRIASSTAAEAAAKTIPTTSSVVTTVPLSKTAPTPDFHSPIVCSLSASECAAIHAKAVLVVESLTKNPSDIDAWIELGTLRRNAGDYTGAAAALEYVSAIYPTNPVSFNNLGDLYLNYIHDNAKGEKNYLVQTVNFPQAIDPYRNLAQLYMNGYKGISTAEAILKKGIAANPKAIELQVLLARYYKSVGRTADMNTAYDAAIASATAQGNTALAANIATEKAGK